MSETPLKNFRKKQVNLEAFLTELLTIKKKSTLYCNLEVRQHLLQLFSCLELTNTPNYGYSKKSLYCRFLSPLILNFSFDGHVKVHAELV